jgi:O-antigen/teichoic acid export membrane protein
VKKKILNRLEAMSGSAGRFSFLKRFTLIFGIDVMVKASSIFLLPIYLRLMTQAEYGSYNYFFSIIQVFTLILNLGLYTPLSKYYHTFQSKEQRGRLLFTISVTLFAFIFLFCILAWLLKIDYWIIGELFKEKSSYSKYREVILFSLVVSVLSFMLSNFFYTSEKVKQIKRYNISRIIIINVAVISGLFFFTWDHVKTRLLLSAVFELVLVIVFGYTFIKETVFKFSQHIILSSLKMGAPIMISAIFGIVINFSDKYFLEKYGNIEDLSSYFLAFSFANVLPFVFASFQNIWLPMVLKESDSQKNFEKTRRIIRKLLVAFMIIGVLVWVSVFLCLKVNVIQAKYSKALTILPLLILAQIVSPITTLYSNYLISIEKTYVASVAGLIVSLISISIGAYLVPRYGVYGSALSIFGSYLSYLVLYYYWVRFENRRLDYSMAIMTSFK